MITQKKDELLTPAGRASPTRSSPTRCVRLEMHYINATTAPLELSGSIDHDHRRTSYHDEANFLFIGNPDIKIARRHRRSTLGPTFFKLDQDTFGDAKFFAFTGHEHQLRHQRDRADGSDAPTTPGHDGLRRAQLELERAGDGVPRPARLRSRPTAASSSPATGTTRRDQTVKFGESAQQRDVLLLGLLLSVEGRLRLRAHDPGRRPRLLLSGRGRVRVPVASGQRQLSRGLAAAYRGLTAA